jgi:hypothetical protein
MMSVARLTDRTAPNSENNLFKLSTVAREDKLCTIILVMESLRHCATKICSESVIISAAEFSRSLDRFPPLANVAGE